MSSLRKRSYNFSPEERQVLLQLCNKYKYTIENKKTNGKTWRAKELCWQKIEELFNKSINGSLPRSAKQLKLKYEGIKKEIRKRYATGGGVSLPALISQDEKELTETIINSLEGLQNPSDSEKEHAGADSGEDIESSKGNEEKIIDWEDFRTTMLPPPLKQKIEINEDDYVTTIDIAEFNHKQEIQDQINEIEEADIAGNTEEDCATQEKPAVKKKKKKSVLEDLAKEKQKLFSNLVQLSEKNLKRSEEEHNLKMAILKQQQLQEEIKTQILQQELEIVKMRVNRFDR